MWRPWPEDSAAARAALGDTRDAKPWRVLCVSSRWLSGATIPFKTISGTCESRFASVEVEGSSGFGYKAIFIPAGFDITWARLSITEKNRNSHRGRAARQIIVRLHP